MDVCFKFLVLCWTFLLNSYFCNNSHFCFTVVFLVNCPTSCDQTLFVTFLHLLFPIYLDWKLQNNVFTLVPGLMGIHPFSFKFLSQYKKWLQNWRRQSMQKWLFENLVPVCKILKLWKLLDTSSICYSISTISPLLLISFDTLITSIITRWFILSLICWWISPIEYIT